MCTEVLIDTTLAYCPWWQVPQVPATTPAWLYTAPRNVEHNPEAAHPVLAGVWHVMQSAVVGMWPVFLPNAVVPWQESQRGLGIDPAAGKVR